MALHGALVQVLLQALQLLPLLAVLGAGPVPVRGARVLAVLPVLSHSHYRAAEPLLRRLAARGHEVVVISRQPQQQPPANWTDIAILSEKTATFKGGIPFDFIEATSPASNSFFLLYAGQADCEDVLSDPRVRALVHGPPFDLVLLELFHTDCFLALAHRLGAPLVHISASAVLPWGNARFGNPDNSAYVPNAFLEYTDEMDFLERVRNTLFLAGQNLIKVWYSDLRDQQTASRYLGADLPRLSDIAKNASLLLVNTFHALSLPRPSVPNVIEVGGIHIGEPKALPQVSLEPQPQAPFVSYKHAVKMKRSGRFQGQTLGQTRGGTARQNGDADDHSLGIRGLPLKMPPLNSKCWV